MRLRSFTILLCALAILSSHCGASAEVAPNIPQSRHDLHFTNAVTRWDEALPLGNGILGALVWGDGQPLKISLDRTDLWDLTPVPEFQRPDYNLATVQRLREEGRHRELIKMLEDPYNRPAPTRIPAGRIELEFGDTSKISGSSLSLREATARTLSQNADQTEIFIHAMKPIGFIRICGTNKVLARLVPPAFGGKIKHAAAGGIGAGDLSQLNYPAPQIQTNEHWQSFLQQGAQSFSYAGFLSWVEHGGEWLAAWSIASSLEGADPLKIARDRVEAALLGDFKSLHQSHTSWWNEYWAKSSVSLPNAVLERQWFLETYKFGAASRRGAPPITLQGPWTADDGQLPPWKGDYHHDLNTQLSYWPCYSGNHLEEGLSYLDWLWQTRSNCVSWTKQFFNLPGLNVPMTTDLANNQIGGWRQYTHSFTTAAWLAQHFYLHWKFSADQTFLRERAWPYLRDAAVFIEAATNERNKNGHRKFPLSSSPEIHDNRPEAWFDEITNYDLALACWLLGATAELADSLGLPAEGSRWRKVQSEFPPFALRDDGALLVSPGQPLRESHRHFSHLMAIHPLSLIDLRDGPEEERIVQASLRDIDRLGSDAWCGYSFAWLGNLAARARNGAKAEHALEIFSRAFTLRNGFHCNGDQSGKGYSKMIYRPFTLEGNFAAAAGIQEMLLQSHRGQIEVFPAIPPSWADAAFTTLRAEGAFLVSAESRAGNIQTVQIFAEKGGLCRVKSPWNGQQLARTLKPGEQWVLSASDSATTSTVRALPKTTGAGNIFLRGAKVAVELPHEGDWTLHDYEGRIVSQHKGPAKVSLGTLPTGFYRFTQNGTSNWVSLGVIEPLRSPTPLSSPVGIDVAMAWFYDTNRMDAVANLCALAGINWVRDRLNWAEMEPQRGHFSAPNKYDYSAAAQSTAGLRVLQVIHQSPTWANPITKRFPPDLRDAFKFFQEMAKRWHGQIQAFEPWNEADILMFGGHTGAEMAALQKAAYLGLKAGNPDMIACLNVFALHNTNQLADLGENEAWPYFDTYNLHHYESFDNYPKLYSDHRAASAGRPLWVSECALPVKWAGDEKLQEPTEADLKVQAERIAKTFACSLYERSAATFYFLLPHYIEGQTQFGLLRPDLTPRPAYVALAAVGRLLADARPLGKLQTDSPSIRAYLFDCKPDGKQRNVLVAWTTERQATLRLPQSPESLFDHLGRESKPIQELSLSGAPILALLPTNSITTLTPPPATVFPPSGKPSPIVMQALWPEENINLNRSAYRIQSGKQEKIPVYLYNFSTSAAKGHLNLHTSSGVKATILDSIELPPMSRIELELFVQIPSGKTDDSSQIRLTGNFADAGATALSIRVIAK